MSRAFAVRGIVEGFYGTPWSHAARIDAISFLAPGEVAGKRAAALAVLARACTDGPLAGTSRLDIAARVDRLEAALDGAGWAAAAADIAAELRAARALPSELAATEDADDGLSAETAPWSESARAAASAGLAALRLLQQVRPAKILDPPGPQRPCRPTPKRRCTTRSPSSISGWPLVPMNMLCTDPGLPCTRLSSSSPTVAPASTSANPCARTPA